MKKQLIAFLIAIGSTIAGAAQDNPAAVVSAMQQLVTTYSRSPQLSFSIEYRYAALDKPGLFLDSMKGQVKISRGRCWYSLAETECILNNDYQILLFKEDQLIYLSKPSKEIAHSMALQGMAPQALDMLDSLLRTGKDIQSSFTEDGTRRVIKLVFNQHPVYKELSWHISKKSGYIERMVSVMKSGQLYDPSVRSQVNDQDSYAIVETLYSNYSSGGVEESVFTTDRYITREGTEYHPAAAYNNYKIFFGSQGL
ncbi:hypothetical protein [Paraflavitalea pollutisoli]|uniref:hypothetical protein n=1 Tax=Paraflavitalea pollutisoli TaxID=3034143 RepID=UPI0023EB97F5|nr:hypothetical protein [Paraflavitalea sp. H1-2-19X]